MKLSTARRRAEHRGLASNHIKHFDDIPSGAHCVICCRVSGGEKKRKRSLRYSEKHLREAVSRHGSQTVGVVSYIGSGFEPYWLVRAARLAREHGAILLAETPNRFIRHRGYHSVRWFDAQARECELEELACVTEGVTLATLMQPDATAGEERSYATKRGKQMSQEDKFSDQSALLKEIWKRLK